MSWPDFMPWIGGLLAVGCLFGAMLAGKRKRLVDNIPTSKTTGVFIGLVEVKGTAETARPLASFLTSTSCVWYAWNVQEHWSRTVVETYTDEKGNTRTRTRHESGWTQVGAGGQEIPFYLKDDCGVIQVLPNGAKVEPATVMDYTCGRSDPLYYSKGPAYAVAHSDHRRRFVETAIPLHAMLYVMGQSRERQDIVAAEIASDSKAPLFLISVRDEKQISSGFAWAYWLWGILGFILALAGLFIHDKQLELDLEQRWLLYFIPAVLYGLVGTGAWLWMAFNSIVDLRQRVNQAWSQVEVQLKRRQDLIPNLVRVVTGLRDYEKNVQTELASLRTQMTATAPGVAGPDFEGCMPRLVAIAERYPELKSQESFAALQKSLSDTEQRIALARGYFNEIATHYNTRLEIIPERYVASIAGLKPQALMQAADFERAPVNVEFQST